MQTINKKKSRAIRVLKRIETFIRKAEQFYSSSLLKIRKVVIGIAIVG